MGRYSNGWIKIQRKAILGDIGSSFTRGGLFSSLVAIANQKESIVSWRGKPLTLGRGELVTSLKELSSLGASDSRTILKHLNYLELRGTISIEKSYGGLLIKFVNFEKHNRLNAEGSEFNVDLDVEMDAEMTPISMREPYIHNEEIKEYKNKRNKEYISSEPKKSVAEAKPKKEMVSFKITEAKSIEVPQDLIKSWSDTYPKEFLDLEIKKARSWVLANEHKSPKSNWGRFLNSWFNKGWDSYRKTLSSNPSQMSPEEALAVLRGE